MSQTLCFIATDVAQIAGNSQGYIFSPHILQYPGPTLDIKAGESLIIVPYQPMGLGPWKLYFSVLVNSELKTKHKSCKAFCIKITNKWITKSIRINRFCSLDALLSSPGLEHVYSYINFDDLNDITGGGDDSDDNDETENDSLPSKVCECSCCLKSR
jgi:hypothetical protein